MPGTPVDEGANPAPELNGTLHPAGRTRQPEPPQSRPQHALVAFACVGSTGWLRVLCAESSSVHQL